MDDTTLINQINKLAGEEHSLFELESSGKATVTDQDRLKDLEKMLDQCWDLLRQRRAKREFGQDPDQAGLRDSATVEKYSG